MKRQRRTRNPREIAQQLEDYKKGFQGNLLQGKTVPLSGVPTTPVDAISKIDTALVPFNGADSATQAREVALHLRDAAIDPAILLLTDLEAGVRATVGTTNPEIKQFGLSPKVLHPHRSVVDKAKAVEKGNQTRAEHRTALEGVTQPAPETKTPSPPKAP